MFAKVSSYTAGTYTNEMHKLKKFADLSARHKRRRLDAGRNAILHVREIADDSTSGSDDIPENELPPAFVPQIVLENLDDEVTDSSREEAIVEEVEDDNIPVDNSEESDRSESSQDEGDNVNDQANLADIQKRALKNVFLEAGIKHNQGNILLKALRQYPFNLNSLPKDTRTLLQTPTVVASTFVRPIAGGEYLHIGFRSTLTKKLDRLPANALPETVDIDFSTDGGKAGTDQFWPHQYRIYNIADKRPIIAGIFKGRHKPTNPFDFYEQFVDEIVEIREEGGIAVGDKRLPLNVRCFIADAPARAFALNHYGHTSANACSKCKIEGLRCTVPGFGGTMIFPGIGHPLRTDEEYRNVVDDDHHKGRSPLTPLLGLVTCVPFESMHLVYLGNMKKIISAQVGGKFGFRRLNHRKVNIINARMLMLKEYCPSEFNRRPNEITMFHSFKATEFRQLLLYTAPMVFKSIVSDEYYQHLMILHCVIRLLISEETPREMYAFCQEALESYVTLCEILYGQQFLSYNVHGLLHVVADVERLGGLDTFSSFCYENNMPEYTKRIRKPHLSLAQYYKRIKEEEDFHDAPVNNNIHLRLSQIHSAGPLPEDIPDDLCQQYNKLQVGKIVFGTVLRDSCCILQDSHVCLIKNIIRIEERISLIVQQFRRRSEVYNAGVTSDSVGVYRCTRLSDRLQAVDLRAVKSKCYRMPQCSDVEGEEEMIVENEWICVALLQPLVLPENAN